MSQGSTTLNNPKDAGGGGRRPKIFLRITMRDICIVGAVMSEPLQGLEGMGMGSANKSLHFTALNRVGEELGRSKWKYKGSYQVK